MVQPIDALVVSLGLDASAFTAGQKQMVVDLRKTETEADRTAKMLQASGKQAAEFFGAIKTQALSLLGVFLGGKGIEEFIRGTASSLTDLRLAARSIGISTQDLQAFEQAIFRMGGQADSARSSLEAMAAAQFNLKTLATDVGFVQFGGKIGERDIANAAPWKIMQEFIAWAATEKDPQQVRYFGGLGHIDPGLVTAILQMNAVSNLAAEMRESFRLGNIASQQQVDAAVKFQESVRRFETAVEGLSRSVIPFETMKNILDGLTRILTKDTSQAQKPGDFNPAMHSGFIGDWFKDEAIPFLERLGDQQLKLADDFFIRLDQRVAQMYLDRNAADRDLITHLPSYVGNPYPNSPYLPRVDLGPGPDISPPRGPTEAHATMNHIHDFFKDKGLTEQQIAGIMAGGPGAESGFNPGLWGDSHSSYGLFQHHADRLTDMQNRSGTSTPSEQQQLEYAWWELTQGRYRGVLEAIKRNPNDPAEVARIWTKEFENPANAVTNAEQRAAQANKFLRPEPSAHVPGQSIQSDVNRWIHGHRSYQPDPALIPRKMLRKEDMESRQSVSHNDNSIAVDIGAVHVNTQATDAKGISADIHRQLSEEIAAQAGRGLQ